MRDPRISKLAHLIINHSCELKAGEKILIEAIGVDTEMIIALIQEVKSVGGVPLVSIKNEKIIRELCYQYDENDIKLMADCELYTLKQMEAFIGIRGFRNINELADVPDQKMKNILKYYIQPVHVKQKNENTKWVVLRWPTSSMAQRAGISSEAFESFYFKACTLDYAKLEKAMEPLVRLMRKTDKVRIKGPNDTDIQFSIKGMNQWKHVGKHNIPDGELHTVPVKNSVNGRIHYNVSSVYYGTTFEDICFDFKEGKIIRAKSNQTQRINQILDVDEGARYLGEFAFGFNPYIKKPMKDILFDEKISGSIHLAQGNAYGKCDNGNRSAIHWDLILRQTPEVGGGDIFFDDLLIRSQGEFILEELQGLNPENLL